LANASAFRPGRVLPINDSYNHLADRERRRASAITAR
jgi:hypothetical protein